LTTGYGYRPITQRAGLIKIAIECWKAINPAPQLPPHRPVVKSKPKAKPKSKPVPKASEESDSSITSADIPLADKKKSKATSKGKGKGKAKQKEDVAEPEPVDIDKRLYEMIMGNEALYIRILRYEVCAAIPSPTLPNLSCSPSCDVWLIPSCLAYQFRRIDQHGNRDWDQRQEVEIAPQAIPRLSGEPSRFPIFLDCL
jgi:hypothetical protein